MPRPKAEICFEPNGATIVAGQEDESRCWNVCRADEYALFCVNDAGTAPQELGCRAAGGPWGGVPGDVGPFCCPCVATPNQP